MLQRAASTAYSWWWASHIRTNQSKWLDDNLQEMEHTVQTMLKLLGEEADSFARRAEMYYSRRPQVINYVEELYRTYRALVERYDHISKELHKANHTIAQAFPEQVQYALLEEDSSGLPKAIVPIDPNKVQKHTVERFLKKKREPTKKDAEKIASGMNKETAEKEIGQIQKAILVLQTEKEFVKNSYETGIAKYWEMEKQIADMQEEIYFLQEEFSANPLIEDDEARALMLSTALKSCDITVGRVKELMKEYEKLAKIELERTVSSRAKLSRLKADYGVAARNQNGASKDVPQLTSVAAFDKEKADETIEKWKQVLESVNEKIGQRVNVDSDSSLDEVAEDVDKLINKVINLELEVSSRNAQIGQWNEENSYLEESLIELENEKTSLSRDDNLLKERLDKANEELSKVQAIQQLVHDEDIIIRRNFVEVFDSIRDISDKFGLPNPEHHAGFEILSVGNDAVDQVIEEEPVISEINQGDEDLRVRATSAEGVDDEIIQTTSSSDYKILNGTVEKTEHDDAVKNQDEFEQVMKRASEQEGSPHIETGGGDGVKNQEDEFKKVGLMAAEQEDMQTVNTDLHMDPQPEQSDAGVADASLLACITRDAAEDANPQAGDPGANRDGSKQYGHGVRSLQEVILHGLEGKDKILLAEYNAILQNFKDTKRRLAEIEKKNKDYRQENDDLGRELRSVIAQKDVEISWLRQLLISAGIPFSTASDSLPSEPSALARNENEHGEVAHAEDDEKLDDTNSSGCESSHYEEKVRAEIDTLIDDNFQFLLRLSSTIHQMQEFESKYEKLKPSEKPPANGDQSEDQMIQESDLTEKELRGLKTEVTVWLEKSALIQHDVQVKHDSLCSLQEEIADAARHRSFNAAADQPPLLPSAAARLQGEVSSIQMANDKADKELQDAVDQVKKLKARVEAVLRHIRENFELNSNRSEPESFRSQFKNFPAAARVPLRNFLFPPKPKKKSLWSRLSPAVTKQRQKK